MSGKASRRVSFSPDMNDKPILYLKQSGCGGTRAGGGRRRVTGVWTLQRLLKEEEALSAPIKLLRGLRAKLSRAVCIISARKRTSRKVSSASSNLTRSRSCSDFIESHRAEALEDCIEFLNSASSLHRTNSVASNALLVRDL